jgi:hypothetical protein
MKIKWIGQQVIPIHINSYPYENDSKAEPIVKVKGPKHIENDDFS